MAEGKVLSESAYARLVADIRKMIAEGRTRAQEAAGRELVLTYWEIGKRISQEALTENAKYGESIMEDLSEELGVDDDTLYRCVHFFKSYNSAPRGGNLTWSHYRELLGVRDNEVRKLLEDKAARESWTRDQLAKAIRARRETSSKGGSPLKGKKFSRPLEPTYVYKAEVLKVVDGDTLLLRFDLGFQVWKEQRIRLADIDCASMDESKGREALNFVRVQLAKAPFVMVKTNKIDIYGRYVGHVFYSLEDDPDKAEVFKTGRYLNQELVEKGLAVIL